jgi:hypothetical protein
MRSSTTSTQIAKWFLAKTPIVEDRSTISTETKVRKKIKTKHHNPTQLLLKP